MNRSKTPKTFHFKLSGTLLTLSHAQRRHVTDDRFPRQSARQRQGCPTPEWPQGTCETLTASAFCPSHLKRFHSCEPSCQLTRDHIRPSLISRQQLTSCQANLAGQQGQKEGRIAHGTAFLLANGQRCDRALFLAAALCA